MPSWNVHTAHVERLIERRTVDDLGISDQNAFLFGNYVPDIYVGFMVPDASMHIDYCITHVATISTTPVPDADFFWDHYIARRTPSSESGLSLALGAWAHLVADRFYNASFRMNAPAHDNLKGDALRRAKQADFDLFGRSFPLSSIVEVNDALLNAAYSFHAYRLLPDDVKRAAQIANAIVRSNTSSPAEQKVYQLLDAVWLTDVFNACDEFVVAWLSAWRTLKNEDRACLAGDIRTQAGIAPAPSFD